MKPLHIFLIFAAVLFGADSILPEVRTALDSFRVRHVTLYNGILKVQTSDRRIDQTQWQVMAIAVCSVPHHGVRELQIVNFSGRYGYALENPIKVCTGIENIPLTKAWWKILAATHTLP